MKTSTLLAAAFAAFVGAGALAATTAPAAADGAYFGMSVGPYGPPAVNFGYQSGYPAYPRPYYGGGYRPYRGYGYRPPVVYRRAPVEVCDDVWTTRRVYDRWGRVIGVDRIPSSDCRLVYR